MWIIALMVACTGSTPAPDASRGDGPDGWGAVFWKDGQAARIGQGSVLVGRGGVSAAAEADGDGVCGGRMLSGAPELTRLSVSPKGEPPELPAQAKVLATTATQAVSQLQGVLPEGDRFTPYVDDPTHFFGMTVGTVAKTRRHMAPPVLLASAVRDGRAALGVLDRAGEELHQGLLLEGWTERAHLLPTADYNGDGAREVVLYGPQDVALFSMDETGRNPSLTLVHRWTCAEADGGPGTD